MTVLHSLSHSDTQPQSAPVVIPTSSTIRLPSQSSQSSQSRRRSTNSIKDIKVLKKAAYGNNLDKVSTSRQSITHDVKNIRKLKKTIKHTGLVLARHAEENVLARYNKLLEKVDSKNYKKRKLCLLVIRIDAQGNLTESKPCSHCVEVLKEYGIRKVSYSTKQGTIVTESLETIITSTSVGYRSAKRALAMLDEMLELYNK